MPVLDIFSKRQKRLRGEVPDTYAYDEIPAPLRVQIVQILEELLERLEKNHPYWEASKAYSQIGALLRREYGVFRLSSSHSVGNGRGDFQQFLLSEESVEKTMDGVEVSFVYLFFIYEAYSEQTERIQEAEEEVNARFREHGVGFQLSERRVVRVDSQYAHAEIVRPALQLLNGKGYSGAQQEFLKAHGHFRKGEMKDVLTECLKSLESVMKSICAKRKWSVREQATAKELIDVCVGRELIPQFWLSQFSSLRGLLESGVPTARNRLGGHGQGPAPTSVPRHIAAYALHTTAAAVIFLAEAEAALP